MSLKINIGDDVLDNAKFVACKVDDNYLRKRVYALGIAANAAAKYLTENGLKTHSNHSLYKSAVFAKEIEIADIYANNARFDVRVTFNDKTFTVPKLHVKYDIKPEAYIVVRFDNSLKEIEFLGFVPENELKYDKNGEEYYTYSLDILKPFEEFIPYAEALKIKPKEYSQEEHENILSLCAAIIDEEAAEADKIYFIKHVAECSSCRDTFCDINDFDDIVSQLKNYHELLNDSTLSVLSGNKKEVDQAAIANMALVENASEDFSEEESKVSGITPPVEETLLAEASAGIMAAGLASAGAAAASIAGEALEPAVLNLYDEPESLLQEQNPVTENTDNDTKTQDTSSIIPDETQKLQEDTASELQQVTDENTEAEQESLLEDDSLTANIPDDEFLLNDEDDLLLEMPDEETVTAEDETKNIAQEQQEEDVSSDINLVQQDEQLSEETLITESPSSDSFDELNASIDAFASEPLSLETFDSKEEQETQTEEAAEEAPLNSSETQEEPEIALDNDELLLEEGSLDEIHSDDISMDLIDANVLDDTEDTNISPQQAEETIPEKIEPEMPINLEESDETEQIETVQDDTPAQEFSFELQDESEENTLNPIEDMDSLDEIGELEEISEEEDLAENNSQELTVQNSYEDVQSDDDLSLTEDSALPELQESDSLEIEDLETLDSIELPDAINTEEEKVENNIETSNPNDLHTEEESEDTGLVLSDEDDADIWPAASQPQEPVELKYDDEPETELNQQTPDNNSISFEEDVFDLNKQEPVIESFDDEQEQHVADFDFPDYNYENLASDTDTPAVQQEIPDIREEKDSSNVEEQETQQPETYAASEDADVQELLDDDLLALLSDDDNDGDDMPSAQDEADAAEPFVAESYAGENMEQNPESPENGEIESLFDEQQAPQEGEQVELDLSQEPMSAETVKKTKKLAIAGALITLLAIGGVAGGYYMYQKNIAAANNDAVDTAQDNQVFDFQNSAAQSGEEDTSSGAVSQDINKSMTNSFSDKPAAISITKLSWQVSEKLAVEPSVKEYLQTAGKNIQLNLQNDLANAADVAFNNSVKVSFEIAPDNTMKGIQILESSGSDKIDAIITKSIRNTLKYVSVPKLKNYNSDYFLTLIINF